MNGFQRASQLLLLVNTAAAFLQGPATTFARTTTDLGAHISAWRDLMFEDVPQKLAADAADGEPVREICILPFPLTDVLLQGETKELCLYEERFHNLFEKATTDHAGIVAMGFIAPPSGMLQGMPLCEIENYRTMEGDTGFGNLSILATIRVVGRATLLDVKTPEGEEFMDGYMTGWCQEMTDDTNTKSEKDLMEVYNELADRCETLFDSIVKLQDEIDSLEQKKESENEVLSEATIRRMKLEAELGLDDNDEDEDDDDDDYLDDDDDDTGPKSALKKAVQIAKASDTQGYTISWSSDSGESSAATKTKRSIQELTALTWGYLSKDVWGEEDEGNILLKYRLQALNTDDLADRFILVSKMLIDQKNTLAKKREKLQ